MFYKKPILKKNFERIFEQIIGNKKFRHILDVGCGTGFYFPVLKKHTLNLTGIDFSPEMIKDANLLIQEKNIKNTTAEVADVENLKYEKNSFDCVLCFDALHHIPNMDKGLKEIKRVLKQKGIFIAVEPNMLNPLMFIAHLIPKEERGAVKRNYPLRLKRKLSKYFQSIDIKYINYIASAKNKRIIKIINALNKNLDKKFYKCFSIRQVIYAKK